MILLYLTFGKVSIKYEPVGGGNPPIFYLYETGYKMADTKVILTSAWYGREKDANSFMLDELLSDNKKQQFLDSILHNNPKDNDGDCHSCGFNLYYNHDAVNIMPYDRPKKIQPLKQKNAEDELVIEMISLTKTKCGAWANYQCPTCLSAGDCTSPFVKKYIGSLFFPRKYAKEK